jgi:isocitrate dehydrogenase (NAD+)
LLLSGLLMLDYIGERDTSARIGAALRKILSEGRVRTRDLDGTATTTEFTDEICRVVTSIASA